MRRDRDVRRPADYMGFEHQPVGGLASQGDALSALSAESTSVQTGYDVDGMNWLMKTKLKRRPGSTSHIVPAAPFQLTAPAASWGVLPPAATRIPAP